MPVVRTLLIRLRALFHKRAVETSLEEEIRHHLELETERLIRQGLPPAEAARGARLSFGGLESVREAHRDARGVRWLEDFIADARYALRSLRRTPALAVAAIATLALGIGANTAIFSAVNAVMLRPLPFPDSDRLVMLWEENPEKGWYQQTVAPANMLDWGDGVAGFSGVAGYNPGVGRLALLLDGQPTMVGTSLVTGNFFSVLGVRAVRGRTFTDAETWRQPSHVAVISDRLWRQAFGRDPSLVGRTIRVDGAPIPVVGIAPASFDFPDPGVDIWLNTNWDPQLREATWFRRAHWFRAVARLRPGVTRAAADAQLQTVVRQLQADYPATNRAMGAGLTPLHAFLVGGVSRPLWLLLGAVALLLLIACGNVGNLLLVRAAGRGRELALRLALGAGRGRIVRQALTESLVLSCLGGGAGVALGWWGTKALFAMQPSGMLPVRAIPVSWPVLLYVLAISVGSGFLFGLAPALWGRRCAPSEALKQGGRRGTAGFAVRRWSEALVVAEVALALLLTVAAGLLVRSFWRLTAVDPGFDPHHVLAVGVNLPRARYDSAARVQTFFDQLTSRARGLPGVEEVAVTGGLPLTDQFYTSDFKVAGWPAERVGFEIVHRDVDGGYFHLMRVPLLRGRSFTPADGPDAPPVVIINQSTADRYFAGQDPLGQRITFDRTPDSTSVWYRIVGVVADEHQASLAEPPRIEAFGPLAQADRSMRFLLLRTVGDPSDLGGAVRAIVRELDPALALYSVETMDQIYARSLVERRFLLALFLGFAVVGVLLAIVGVYGVMAQLARGRVRELGIRVALGARTGQVQWLVVRRGLRLVLTGLGLGLLAALSVTRLMVALLYQTSPSDPPTFLAVPALLAATGLIACWLPALRASRANPVVALREG